MKTRMIVVASILVMLGANLGWAQVDQTLRVNIPFAFTVGEKELPPGVYEFSREALNSAIRVCNVKGGPSADVLLVSRLWRASHRTSGGYHVVFHQMGARHIFAEMWIPQSNGFLLANTKGTYNTKTITFR